MIKLFKYQTEDNRKTIDLEKERGLTPVKMNEKGQLTNKH